MGWEVLENQGTGALGNGLLGKFGETGPYPQLVAPLWVQRNQWDHTKFTCWRSETIFPNLGELGDLGNQREMHDFRYSAHTSDNIVLPPLPAKAALSALNEALHEQPQSPVLALLLLTQDAKAKGGSGLGEKQVFCLNAAQQSSKLSYSTVSLGAGSNAVSKWARVLAFMCVYAYVCLNRLYPHFFSLVGL